MKKVFNILLFIAIPAIVVAQDTDEKIQEAYALYKQGMYLESAEIIDDIVETKKGMTSKIAWHIRGFIYKDIYYHVDNRNSDSKSRDKAIDSFKKSIVYDEAGSLEENNRKALRYLGVSFHTDAANIIEDKDPYTIDAANDKYFRYKELMLYLYPDTNLQAKDIEFYLAMATVYRKISEAGSTDSLRYVKKSISYIDLVLEVDEDNWDANYSKAVIGYNEGAMNLQQLPNAEGIHDIYQIQSESIRAIEMALPFMQKAYEINPEKIESIKGLKLMHINLHHEEESEKFEEEEKKVREELMK